MANLRIRSSLTIVLLVAALATRSSLVLANDGSAEPKWAPVIVDQGAGSEQTLTLVNAIATALRTKQRVDLIDPGVAARQFEQLQSVAPVEVPDDKLRELGDGFRKALEAAALGQWETAYSLVRSFDELSQPVQDYVTWKLDLSRDISVYCLMSVHFMLAAHRDSAARDEMRNCFYSAPDRTPSAKDTPEDVIQLHAQVKAELLAQGEASLDVDISGAPRTAEGCAVVVNGVPKGGLPYRETGLLPVPMRVQVNCQRPGRIHVVHLKAGRNSLIVDLRFEEVVRTDGYLSLHYGTEEEERSAQRRDELTLAKLLGASDLLLVHKSAEGLVSFQRIGTQDEKVVSEVSLAPKSNADEISAAAQALATSRSGRIAGDDGNTEQRLSARGHGSASPYGGIALATGSVATLAIGWVSYAEAMPFRKQVAARNACAVSGGGVDVLCVQAFAKYTTLRDFTLVFGALGSSLGVAALPALLPDSKGVPAWSWIVGGLGVAAAATGIGLWSSGDSCSFSKCAPDHLDASLGQMLLIDSAPLLGVPMTYAIRSLVRSDNVEARASYLPAGGSVTLSGRF